MCAENEQALRSGPATDTAVHENIFFGRLKVECQHSNKNVFIINKFDYSYSGNKFFIDFKKLALESKKVMCDKLLSPLAWSANTSPISSLDKDDLPLLDEQVALEAAGDDLEFLV